MTRLREVLLYGAGAAAAFAVDVSLLAVLVELVGLHYLLAATISFAAGTVVVYVVSIRYAFTYRRLRRVRSEFVIFAALGGLGVLVNLLVMYGGVQALHLHYLYAKALAASVTFLTNYITRRTLLFTRLDRKLVARIGSTE